METVVTARSTAASELHDLATQLERQSGFAQVLKSLAAGDGGTLGGVWGSSCALASAALQRSCPGPLVVVLPHARDIDSFCDDLALFTETPTAQFPAWESDAGERVFHDEIYGQRLRVLKRCQEPFTVQEPPPASVAAKKVPDTFLIVTAIQSLMQPVPSADDLTAATRTIAVGDTLDTDAFTRWLAEQGCASTTAIELPGEFSLRGGILDIFSPEA
ncbi:MAG: transcription-repair coupling factor, partial [Planctomycetes bacterium]|nr:transcription-repair coupling factor [Planctomycetota bacterium]